MILSRAKPAIPSAASGGADSANAGAGGSASKSKQLPRLEDFLSRRDYAGAMSLLEFNRNSGRGSETVDLWLGYCAFHMGDYKRAMLEYEALTHAKSRLKMLSSISLARSSIWECTPTPKRPWIRPT